MPRRLKPQVGDVFLVRQSDGLAMRGQVLGAPNAQIVTIAMFRQRVTAEAVQPVSSWAEAEIVCVLNTAAVPLKRGLWPICGRADPIVPRRADVAWLASSALHVGMTVYGCLLLEDFLNAFCGLRPWDEMHDPKFYETMLYPGAKKPGTLIYKRSTP